MSAWPIEASVPVAWGDLDAFGHVNNTVYFRWFETARIALFQQADVLAGMQADRIGPILARTHCDFRLPVAFPDTVLARAGIRRVGTTSYVMAYQVWSLGHDAVAAEGEGVIVQLDYASGAKVPIDEPMRARLLALGAPG